MANWWVSRLRYKYIAECRVEMIDSILRAEVGYVSSRQVGELINDIQTEVERSLNFITQSIKAVCAAMTIICFIAPAGFHYLT